jgi:hypothetical protein
MEVVSIILYIVIPLRILCHKKMNKIGIQNNPVNHKISSLMKLEKQTISDLVTNFVIVAAFAVYWFVLVELRNTSPLEFNLYPNYIYIYFHQFLWAPIISALSGTLYYTRHPPLSKTIGREVQQFIGNNFN